MKNTVHDGLTKELLTHPPIEFNQQFNKNDLFFSSKNRQFFLKTFFSNLDVENKEKGLAFITDIKKFHSDYYSISLNSDTQIVFNQKIEAKQKIIAQLVKTNESLIEWLQSDAIKDVYQEHTSLYKVMSCFYPEQEIVDLDDDGNLIILNESDFDYSEILKDTFLNKRSVYRFIAVSPPTNSGVYNQMINTFNNNLGFFNYGQSIKTEGLWNNYKRGKNTPTPINWGLFLLFLGIHPLYQLEERKDDFKNTQLFKAIYPNWDSSFNQKLWEYSQHINLKPYKSFSGSLLKKKKNKDVINVDNPAAVRSEIHDLITDWFNHSDKTENPFITKNPFITNYRNALSLISFISKDSDSISEQKDLNREKYKILFKLVKLKVITSHQLDEYLASFRKKVEITDEIEELLLSKTRVAFFIHQEPNPNPNFYTLMRLLMGGPDTRKIPYLTEINQASWMGFEKGKRVPKSGIWAALLLCLDIHPMYRIKPRQNSKDIKESFQIYMALHDTAKATGFSFYLPKTATEKEFRAVIQEVN